MKTSKRILAAVLVFCLTMCLVAAMPVVSAADTQQAAPELWVLQVPAKPNSEIAKAYRLFFQGFAFSELDSTQGLTLGTPFSFATAADTGNQPVDPSNTMYYFPVMQDGKIVLTYRWVYYGSLPQRLRSRDTAVGSIALTEELNAFIGKTSEAKPLVIYLDENEDIVLQGETLKKVIQVDPTKERITPAERNYADFFPANTETGMVGVNVMEPAQLRWGIPLWALGALQISLTLKPFRLRAGLV